MADIVIFVATPEPTLSDGVAVDALGAHFISIVKSQGLPSHVGLFQGLSVVAPKQQTSMKRFATEFFHQGFGPETRVMFVDSTTDCAPLIRWVQSQKLK